MRRPCPTLLLLAALVPGCKADASLREGLVADTIATEQTSWPRPSHVASPTPGTFGEAAEPVVAALVAGIGPLPSPEVALASPPPPPPTGPGPCDGFVPHYAPERLLPECRTSNAGKVVPLAPLLAATHRAEAGPPESLRTTDPALALPRTRAVFLALRELDIAAGIAMASPETRATVLAACADRLALIRDLGWGGLLLIDVIGTSSLGQALSTCARAADRPPGERRAGADAIEAVRRGMPPFLHIVRRENALMEVRAWGDELDDDERARVPETLRREIRPSEATWDEWRAFRAHATDTEAALSAPTADERLRRMKELDAKAGNDAPQWARYLSIHDRHLAAVDAFVWALRATADELDGKSLPALPPDLAAIATSERSPGGLKVTVRVEDEPAREIVLDVPMPNVASPSAP